jgi:bifunctional non-homologous end joining protein LigD
MRWHDVPNNKKAKRNMVNKRKASVKNSKRKTAIPLLSKGRKSTFPIRVEPMLATLERPDLDSEDWIYELKLDGYRIIAQLNKGDVKLHSRGLQNYTRKYPPVVKELKKFNFNAVIDGEIVVVDDKGFPQFNALQNYREGDNIIYYVFDILWLNGYDLTKIPLIERKQILESVLPKSDVIKYLDYYIDGKKLYDQILTLGLEGVMAKLKDSLYYPGQRVKSWLKVKTNITKDYILLGWTESTKRKFKSLLFGEYRGDELFYVHHSGGGFTDKVMDELYSRLKKIEIKKKPFVNIAETETKQHYVKPLLVAEFEISGKYNPSGSIRHPAIFIKLQDYIDPKTIISDPQGVRSKKGPAEEKSIQSSGDWEMVKSRIIISREKLKIEGKNIELINIENVLWKSENITKADLLHYYIKAAPYILPHLKDRPIALNVNLQGPHSEGFFLRGTEGNHPSWARIYKTKRKHPKPGKSDTIEWLLCNDLATLIYIINLECIDIHPWNSRITSPKEPDYIAIDLDPSDNDFKKAIKTALVAKQLFDKHKLKSFIKTSGKSGMHLLLPCSRIAFGDARKIALHICNAINKEIPSITTLSTATSTRGNKLYVDPSQNDYADRLAVTYCVRAAHHPTVSTPIQWSEVNEKLDPKKFTIATILDRLETKGDLWKKLLDETIRDSNSTILRKII